MPAATSTGTFLRILLLTSLGLNAVLVAWLVQTGPEDSADERPPPSRSTESGISGFAQPDQEEKTSAPSAGSAVLVPFSRPPAASDRQAPVPAPGKSLVSKVDAETQSDILCEIARRTARDEWRRKRDQISSGLRRSLADADEQERNVRNVAQKVARLLHLDPDDREALEQLYREIRLPRIERVRRAVASEPADYRAVYQEALGLFADEDRLISELYGPGALERLRLSELESRSTVLALLASLAGIGWDQVVGW